MKNDHLRFRMSLSFGLFTRDSLASWRRVERAPLTFYGQRLGWRKVLIKSTKPDVKWMRIQFEAADLDGDFSGRTVTRNLLELVLVEKGT